MHIVHKLFTKPYYQWLFLLQIHATRTDYYAQLKTLFSDNLCELLLCSTSATRVMYCLGYVDTAPECNIQTCKYPDFLLVTAKYFQIQ